MCNTKDAKRYVELAKLNERDEEYEEARKNYLEAASIYVLEAEVRRDDSILKKANYCYKKSKEVIGETFDRELTKQELAMRTLTELNEENKQNKSINKQDNKTNDQGEKKMCGEKSIKTLIEIGKKIEKSDPQEAAKNYLEAADLLLKESYDDPSREDEYIAVANKIYLKAKELKQQKTKITQIDSSHSDLLSKKDNKIKFSDIGGLEELKDEIKFKIIEPFQKPDLFKYYGKSVGGGILMYGPPGCGKSLIAKATANEANANFIHVKSSDLKSKFVGETEKNIAELFENARKSQPTIIFFDEFEALGGDRTDGLAHEKSSVAQLLTEMDGMDSEDQQILLLAATNEPWSIDPALRREGRFGKTLFIPQPDSEARKEIFKISLKNRPIGKVDFNKLVKLSKGFSGADIKSVCELATDIPLRESIVTNNKRNIELIDLLEGIEKTKTQSILNQWFKKASKQVTKRKLEDSFKELVDASAKISISQT
ncbi:ATP-binding protein [Candidatus Woesearchaeota archaeon]|jgi:transitional endoplasmic reticulum ATPase|nr:ATP-binding protein [Candidatus Woesearchaeota archaeon]MBT6518731.1 ATP-binding protein [Candidatus Woesearchaeota archaeon]MBT7367902.1 ATP-binding protein [Candidatus Woesearchaeota archaeon]